MNDKGQLFFFTLMLATVVIVLALAMIPAVRQQVDISRAPSTTDTVGLDCNNSTIPDFQKAQCVLTDLATPYFFFGLIAIAGVIIGAKLIFGGAVQ